MKSRVTLTMDVEIAKRAKKIAHARRTSVSALIEDLIRRTTVSTRRSAAGFVETWAGKFDVRNSDKADRRLEALKNRYGLK